MYCILLLPSLPLIISYQLIIPHLPFPSHLPAHRGYSSSFLPNVTLPSRQFTRSILELLLQTHSTLLTHLHPSSLSSSPHSITLQSNPTHPLVTTLHRLPTLPLLPTHPPPRSPSLSGSRSHHRSYHLPTPSLLR